MSSRLSRSLVAFMVAGYAFLYAPIFFVILFSFNSSAAMIRFEGFSLQWYTSLFSNHTLLNSVLISFQIAIVSATLAVFLGVLCALILVRLRPFRGRSLLGLMSTAPLIMPEVITGLAFLMFFVSTESVLGWPSGRGIQTVIIAHTTLALAYVTVIVRARLLEMDTALEEAAMDLGARPIRVFFRVTLPIIAPSLFSGWLLAFALSMDDLVVASFTAGPGSSTLPMVIFSSIRMGANPQINAVATLIVFVVAACVLSAGLLMHRKNQRLLI